MPGNPESGLELVRDQVNRVSDFHAFLTVARLGKQPGVTDLQFTKKSSTMREQRIKGIVNGELVSNGLLEID
jgi:hypothetical protein